MDQSGRIRRNRRIQHKGCRKVKLKIFVILLLCVTGMVIVGCTYRAAEGEYPDFTLTSSSGAPVTLSSFKHESIVVLGVGDPYT
jgi:hypothetical protein